MIDTALIWWYVLIVSMLPFLGIAVGAVMVVIGKGDLVDRAIRYMSEHEIGGRK